MKQKSNTKWMVGVIIILILVIVGISYAAYLYVRTGTKINTLTLGNLELTLTEGAEINLSDTYPLTDAQGLATPGYSFTLKNTGNVPAVYSIYLDNVAVASGETKLDDRYIKFSLAKGSTTGAATLLTSVGTEKNRLITSDTLTANTTYNYILRVWPTGEVDGDIAGQVWKGKIRLEGSQVK